MAEVKVLIKGYTSAYNKDSGNDIDEKTCATITLIKDKDKDGKPIFIVVDPGVLEDRKLLIDSLRKENLNVNDITYVALTHSHLDHFVNMAMFPNAKFLDFTGLWENNVCNDWNEDFSKNIRIIKTPGHDRSSITLLVKTEKGIVAIVGDVFWKEGLPIKDPYADNPKKLIESRKKVLELADWIIPGHGDIYKVKK